jgi:hypothetical protein
MSHVNDAHCEKCQEILNKYPNVEKVLRDWFEAFQLRHSEAHISCAGRGKKDQTDVFDRGVSRAQWGHSAHNYNCAIDIFVNYPGDIYNKAWYGRVLKPFLIDALEWYGELGSVFYELPHVQVKAWRDMKSQGLIRLVELDEQD